MKNSNCPIPPLQASKWIKIPILLDVSEINELFDHLGPFYICLVSHLLPKEGGIISKNNFLELYTEYVELLKKGIVEESKFRNAFSSAFTLSLDCMLKFNIKDQEIIRPVKPVIQLQSHRFSYSLADGKFYSMTFSPESISWGLQFSYPQLFQEDKTKEVKKVDKSVEFPNTALFLTLQKWIRHHSSPTPFFVEGKKVNVPMRLGKKCFSWINNHPQLNAQNIKVL